MSHKNTMGVSDFSFFSINPHVYLFLYSAEISVGRQGGEESGVVGVASKQVREGLAVRQTVTEASMSAFLAKYLQFLVLAVILRRREHS